MSRSASFIQSLRKEKIIWLYGRNEFNLSGDPVNTHREHGGYNNILPEFVEVLDGKREHLGTCFKENLAFIRKRNNPRDRLIIAQIWNGDRNLCHCFILNGNNIWDHSNFRKKCVDLDMWSRTNKILQWCEPDREQLFNEPICDNDLKACCKNMIKGGNGNKKQLTSRTGDWDIAAKLVM